MKNLSRYLGEYGDALSVKTIPRIRSKYIGGQYFSKVSIPVYQTENMHILLFDYIERFYATNTSISIIKISSDLYLNPNQLSLIY